MVAVLRHDLNFNEDIELDNSSINVDSFNIVMPPRKYKEKIALTEQNFQRFSPRTSTAELSTSPSNAPLTGVYVLADRQRSLDKVCSACAELLLREDTLGLLTTHTSPADDGLGFVRRVHHISKDSFKSTSRQGCGLCVTLKRVFRTDLASPNKAFEKNKNELEFPFSFDPRERTIAFHHPRNLQVKSVVFDLVAYPGSTTWPIIRRKPPEADVASERSFKQATRWLQDCVKHHSSGSCPKLKKTPLPKRVIDVSNIHPRLHLSDGVPGKYACLSYCWGISWKEQVVTTSENVKQHSNRIIFDNLPQTIKDAITVTRRLNLRYIWIDRLCIVQDDEVEREQELEKMGGIFANAYVTISAATAKTCADGFLHERQLQSRAYTPPIKIPIFSPTGYRDHIMLFQRGSATTREPIHYRTWTLQEDLLSTRLLFYGDFEVVWACATCVKTISGIQAEICETGETEMARLRRLFAEGSGPKQPKTALHSDSITMARWEDLIREYSRRELSRSDDKLPALAGLAMKFEPFIDGEYLAGMWSCWLPTHLLWKITGPTGSGIDQHDNGPWRAPTWSWLSMDSPVEVDVESKKNFSVLAVRESYAIVPVKMRNLFGRLKSASITLRGIVNEASDHVVKDIIEGKSTNFRRKTEVVLDEAPFMSSSYYPEYTFFTIGSVACRPKTADSDHINGDTSKELLRTDSRDDEKIALGIVLSLTGEGTNTYHRVGWFRSLPSQTEFLTGPEMVITII